MTHTDTHAPPECPNGHGPMTRRDPDTLTPEQKWMGEWWDCPPGPKGETCMTSVLQGSDALLASLEAATGKAAP